MEVYVFGWWQGKTKIVLTVGGYLWQNQVLSVFSRCPQAGGAQGAWAPRCLINLIALHWGSCTKDPPAMSLGQLSVLMGEVLGACGQSLQLIWHTNEPPASQQNPSSAVSAWSLITITSSQIFSGPPAFLKSHPSHSCYSGSRKWEQALGLSNDPSKTEIPLGNDSKVVTFL